MAASSGFDENLRPIFDAANEAWKRRTRGRWHEFFVDGVAFQADWLGAIHPELTRAYLLALADLHNPKNHNGEAYERARKMFDVARRELLEAFDDGQERARQ